MHLTLLSIADSPKMIVAVVPPWPPLLFIDRLSILFPIRMEEGHRGGNRLYLVESLGFACVSITLMAVADSPKNDVDVVPPWSCPSIDSQYRSLFAGKRDTEEVIVSAWSSL